LLNFRTGTIPETLHKDNNVGYEHRKQISLGERRYGERNLYKDRERNLRKVKERT